MLAALLLSSVIEVPDCSVNRLVLASDVNGAVGIV
jgi:hypothetical protein